MDPHPRGGGPNLRPPATDMLNVHLRITAADTRRPVAARVRVSTADGAQFAPLGRAVAFPAGRNEAVGGCLRVGAERWFHIDGACEIALPAGVPLRVQAAKGPEWNPLDEQVTLGAGQISLRFEVSRWADSRADGWQTVDTRSHFLTPHAALLEAACEDVDVANLLAAPFPLLALDADTYTTVPNLLAFSGQAPALEANGRAVFVNTFNAHPVLGKVALLNSHRPVFPLTFGGEESDDWGVCDWADQCHRKRGLVVWCEAFEPGGGVAGGEALAAALLGKIDALEVAPKAGKSPLLPWVYRLWDAGFRVPLVGASAKDSNAVRLGAVRTYTRASGDGSWLDAVRAGRTFVTSGPLVTLTLEGGTLRTTARTAAGAPRVEIVANGAVVASGEGTCEAPAPGGGWAAARSVTADGFAHTSAVPLGPSEPRPEAVAALLTLLGQTRDWVLERGRFHNPKRREGLLERLDAAARALGGRA